MGIEKESVFSQSIEPKEHGKLNFFIHNHEFKSENWEFSLRAILKSCKKPCLVVTTNHNDSKLIGSFAKNIIYHHPDFNRTILDSISMVGENGIFVAAGIWSGLDSLLRFKSIIIPKIPYGQPKIIDDEIISHFFESKNKAHRRLHQVIGRGLRTPDAECDIYILDEKIKNFKGFYPKRFEKSFKNFTEVAQFTEGTQYEHTLTSYERDKNVRKEAFKFHGTKCQGMPGGKKCSYVVTHLTQLEVHHVDLISQGGSRKTKMEDVQVLCASCHRLAHALLRGEKSI